MLDTFYVRTDFQCLEAFANGCFYRVQVDPGLTQTYYSIHLDERLIYFKDLISKRILAQDPIGLAIYKARRRSIKDMQSENKKQERCLFDVEALFLMAGRKELLDGRDLSNEPLYVKGEDLLGIVTRAGYSNVETEYNFLVDLNKMYLIPANYIEDEKVSLIPDVIADIVGNNFQESSRIFASYN